MKKILKKIFRFVFFCFLILFLILIALSFKKVPQDITYGVSFSKFHSDELRLPWKEVYLSILDDLKVRNFRFSAHWPNTEPEDGKYNFSELDFQMKEAEKRNAQIIFAVGRRLPGWPECHDPVWTWSMSKEEKQKKLLEYIETVVNRYKTYPNIKYWQVENEPFLSVFANMHCGDLDKDFLQTEIDLFRKLDPNRQILVTDSGELGTWYNAYKRGDAFGTSIYLYVWNKYFGDMRYPITTHFFKIKQNLMTLIYGKKPILLIEMSTEPWLLKPIVDTSIDIAKERMSFEKFNNMIEFSSKTGMSEQYLWGVEWWYYMKERGYSEYWDRAKELFSKK